MRLIDCGDVLIVGTGLAGIYTALNLSPLKVSLISAAPLSDGASSNWAQGGIAAALSEGDTPQQHAKDTLSAGCHLNNPDIVKVMTEDANDVIHDLLSYGVPFDRSSKGDFLQGQEAAHSHKRIVKIGGDGAGRQIMASLISSAQASEHINVLTSYILFDFAFNDHKEIIGVYARPLGRKEPILFTAPHVILATGGIGYLYKDTTNPYQIRGEALGCAKRHNIDIKDAEFVQFHPTALDLNIDPSPLATEAIRGEGGRLVNQKGSYFMDDLHPLKDLAPRDVIARAIAHQKQIQNKTFLDVRHINDFETHFPKVFHNCISNNINPQKELIPIKPAQHYHMGGIATNIVGQSSIKNLYAVGEVAGTGAHGANRLASNSLLEALVFSKRAARHILHQDFHKKNIKFYNNPIPINRQYAKENLPKIRSLMTQYVGIVRTYKGLITARDEILKLDHKGRNQAPFTNYAHASLSIIESALKRKKSIGAHYILHDQADLLL